MAALSRIANGTHRQIAVFNQAIRLFSQAHQFLGIRQVLTV